MLALTLVLDNLFHCVVLFITVKALMLAGSRMAFDARSHSLWAIGSHNGSESPEETTHYRYMLTFLNTQGSNFVAIDHLSSTT